MTESSIYMSQLQEDEEDSMSEFDEDSNKYLNPYTNDKWLAVGVVQGHVSLHVFVEKG